MKLLQTKHGANSTSGGRLFGPSTRYRRMPSSLRTMRAHTAPTTRRKGTRSFPGLHAADDTCPGLSAGVCIRYTRVRMPVALKGEWRPNGQQQQQQDNNNNNNMIPGCQPRPRPYPQAQASLRGKGVGIWGASN